MKSTRFYLTTPIYYVNDVPHVGHAYTTIAADALTRARRLQGHDVFFLTGTDEHGQNIERIAREKGIPEQEHCDRIAAEFRNLWKSYGIEYDDFIRTTEERHVRGVLALWKRLRAAKTPDGRDAVYLGKYAGWYCPRCEAFYDEDELKQPGNACPVHELACEWTEEENFFFRLSAYRDWLRDEIESGRIRIEPIGRRNEVLSVVRQGLQDFSVSRARVTWGIPVPEQPDHVLYVWFDALANYVTALGLADDGPLYLKYWKGADQRMHLIGKDIIRFHCLYWPAILHAAGLPVPTRLFAQGWITKNGRKLSKTSGNVIDPVQLVKDYGADAVRYFLLREGVYGQDWDFTDDAFLTRFNADLANDLGNLASRTLTMVKNYCGGKVPPGEGVAEALAAWDSIFERYEALDFSGALSETWSHVGRMNQEIVAFAPWVVAKDSSRRGELEAFLRRQLERLRLVAVFAFPAMPLASARTLAMLGIRADRPGPEHRVARLLETGAPLGAIEPLFPRIERKKKEKPVTESSVPPAPSGAGPVPSTGDKIDIADFARVELRVAQITAAEKIAGSKKLIKLQVDLGAESRQVVAGIAESYEPEVLVGRKIAVVANLKPAKLMGVESNGMVLAASLDGKAVLCAFDADVPAGTKIK
jgi:methionyl-tRNA synthetase